MTQSLLNLLTVDNGQAAWNATINTNFEKLRDFIKTFASSIATQGDTGNPSSIEVQVQDADGNDVEQEALLRVRVCTEDALTAHATATIAAGAGTSVAETITATKDLILKSSAAGLFTITLTNGTANTADLRFGPSLVSPLFADYEPLVQVAHSAP